MSRKDDILRELGAHECLTAAELAEHIYDDRGKQSYLSSFLASLVNQGLIAKRDGGPAAIYSLLRLPPHEIDWPFGEDVAQKLTRFVSQYNNQEEGGPNTRYKSWEWCHNAFLNGKNEYNNPQTEIARKNEIVDYLSLHLAFYLASWGMYRGSSYLLQRDYKCHKRAVELILDPFYEILWDYQPNEDNISEASQKLFSAQNGIYSRVKNSYQNYEGNEDLATETLTTKILLGTFGCVPAFDRFLKKGIGNYKRHFPSRDLTQSIENNNGRTFQALARFAIHHMNEFIVEANANYPPMKCVDMYFWEVGYELDIADGLGSSETSTNKKHELRELGVQLGICTADADFEAAASQIKNRN